jgi:hypothetical protein
MEAPNYDFVFDSLFLYMLFGGFPSLERVDVHRVEIDRDGPSVYLTFNLPEFAKNVPPKWSQYNTVQMTLAFLNVSALSVGVPRMNMMCDIVMEKVADGVMARITGDFEMSLRAEWVQVRELSAYLQCPSEW